MRILQLLLLALLAASAGPAYPASDETPMPASELKALTESAEAGDAGAQYELGKALLTGRRAQEDRAAGKDWLLKSAAQEHPRTLRYLGQLHIFGSRLFPRDMKLAYQYLERAAATGDVDASYDLGSMLTGIWFTEFTPQDREARALELLRYAAEHGHANAMFHLGKTARDGFGGTPDPAAARTWFEKAAAAGSQRAHMELAEMFDKGDVLARDLPRAITHYDKAAELVETVDGYVDEWYEEERARLHLRIGELHELKRPPDLDAALAYYEKVRTNDGAERETQDRAKLRFARLVADHGNEKQAPTGLAMMAQEANAYRLPAMCFMIGALRTGRPGVPPDPALAKKWEEAFWDTARRNQGAPDDCNAQPECKAKLEDYARRSCAEAYLAPLE